MAKQTIDYSEYNNQNADWRERTVDHDHEIVQYQNNSTVRIWYNDLPEEFAPHWHTAMEVILPIENHYEVVTRTTRYSVKPGELLVIPPCESHHLIAPATGKRFIYLFDLTQIRDLKGFSLIQPLLKDCLYITGKTYPQIAPEVYRLFYQMQEDYFSSDKFREMTIHSMLLQFFVLLGRNQKDSIEIYSASPQCKQKEYMQKFNAVLEYIDTHYMDNLTLDDIARISGFSKYHFTRLFKRYTSSTFYDYLNLKRTRVVEQYLVESDLSVTEIALSAGFTSIATFNRIFKKYTDCTPTEYRALNRPPRFRS